MARGRSGATIPRGIVQAIDDRAAERRAAQETEVVRGHGERDHPHIGLLRFGGVAGGGPAHAPDTAPVHSVVDSIGDSEHRAEHGAECVAKEHASVACRFLSPGERPAVVWVVARFWDLKAANVVEMANLNVEAGADGDMEVHKGLLDAKVPTACGRVRKGCVKPHHIRPGPQLEGVAGAPGLGRINRLG